MITNLNKMKKTFVFTLTLILLASFITAAGVSSPYWKENPIKLAPGESTIVTLYLQNMVGSEDMTLRVSIDSDVVLGTLVDLESEYFVPLGSSDVPVQIKLEIPENVQKGGTYQIPISFQQVSSGEGGMIKMASALSINLPVEIVDVEESVLYGQQSEKGINFFLVALVILIGIALLTTYVIQHKGKKK